MYAIIRDGGRQYKVAEGQELMVDSRDVEPGQTIEFDEVLLVSANESAQVGTPVVSGAKVIALTLNHEDMTESEVEETVTEYESQFGLPTTDVLIHGCEKLLVSLAGAFPELFIFERVSGSRTRLREASGQLDPSIPGLPEGTAHELPVESC